MRGNAERSSSSLGGEGRRGVTFSGLTSDSEVSACAYVNVRMHTGADNKGVCAEVS